MLRVGRRWRSLLLFLLHCSASLVDGATKLPHVFFLLHRCNAFRVWVSALQSITVSAVAARSGIALRRRGRVTDDEVSGDSGCCECQLRLDIVTAVQEAQSRREMGCVCYRQSDYRARSRQRRAGGQRIGSDKGASHVNQSHHMFDRPRATHHLGTGSLLQCRSQISVDALLSTCQYRQYKLAVSSRHSCVLKSNLRPSVRTARLQRCS